MADLNWSFTLSDAMSGPASAIVASLKDMQGKLSSIDAKLKGTEKATKAAGGEMRTFGEKARDAFSAFDHALGIVGKVGEFVRGAAELGGRGIEGVFKFEEASVEALSFKENTLASFKTLLGSSKEAEAFFQKSALLGKASPFKTKDVVASYRSLLGAGFTKEEVPNVFQGIGDVSAMSGFSSDVIQRLQLAFAEIMSTGRLEGRQLRMVLIDAAGAGISAPAIATSLAKNLNIPFNDALARLHSDAVESRTAIKAILDTIATKAGGGILGGGAKAYENTFSGIKSTLESTFDEFFYLLEGGTERVAGFTALKGAMMNLRGALMNTTPEGKHLQDSVVGAFNNITTSIFGTLSGPDGLKNMSDLVDRVAFGIDNVGKVAGFAFEAAVAGLKSFGAALGITQTSTGNLSSIFDGPMSPERLEQIRIAFVKFGDEAGTRMGTLASSLTVIANALDKIAGAMTFVSKATDMFPDPSVVAKAQVEYAARDTSKDWLAKPASAVPGWMSNPSGAISDWSDPHPAGMAKTPGGGNGAAGGAQTNTFNVTVDASGTKDPGEVARATALALRDAIPPFVRRMSTQAGGD